MVRERLCPQYGTLYKTVLSNIDGTLKTEPSNMVRVGLNPQIWYV